MQYITNWSALKHTHYGELKGLYRIAVSVQHDALCTTLWNILQTETQFTDVVATFEHNARWYEFNNVHKTEDARVLRLVDKYMHRTEHKPDIDHYPEIAHQHNSTRHKMVSYHAEKKALV
eukprot:CAMPEP_0202719198 /NCGR_PEP_ID=MMETSP1385-20130828/128962_1 /ASSEMBLY_ACC=CAM_ASM_000861 /TAXON_ID=933848 /ORGANISM="Elphidium margaritaceum" /LENGTH=119 /DNA_ID=CAMNT_0049382273 /DNA_START=33 /DNA_END=388 /DNA_ORIENTATION=-